MIKHLCFCLLLLLTLTTIVEASEDTLGGFGAWDENPAVGEALGSADSFFSEPEGMPANEVPLPNEEVPANEVPLPNEGISVSNGDPADPFASSFEGDESQEPEGGNQGVVSQEPEGGNQRVVLAFEPISDGARNLYTKEKPELGSLLDALPGSIRGMVEDGTVLDIPVSWMPTGEYENTAFFYYTFTPVLDASYVAAEGLEFPYIVLWLGEGEVSTPTEPGIDSMVSALRGTTNEEKCFYFFTEQMGLNSAAACGILANIRAESNFDPGIFGDSGNSYGICQWYRERKNSLIQYCNKNGLSYQTLEGQLKYLDYELTNEYPSVLSQIRSVENTSTGAYNAAYIWCTKFEIPADKENQGRSRGYVARDTYWPKYVNAVIDSQDIQDTQDVENSQQNQYENQSEQSRITVTFGPWSEEGRTYVRDTDAAIGSTVTVTGGTCTQTGMYLLDSTGTRVLGKGINYFYWPHVYFKANAECNVVLTPGTDYLCIFYAIVDGQEFKSDPVRFTTTQQRNIIISFDPDGGTSVDSITLERGKSIERIPTSAKAGYFFEGWFTPEGTKVTTETVFTQSVRLKAQWTIDLGAYQDVENGTDGSPEENEDPELTEDPEEGTDGRPQVDMEVSKDVTFALQQSEVTLYVGSSEGSARLQLKQEGFTEDELRAGLSYLSFDRSVATVNANGVITAKKKGKTTVIATMQTKHGVYEASCKVVVKKPTITVSTNTLTVRKGKTVTLKASVYPEGTIKFISSDKKIATVTKTGKVKGKKQGTTTITVKCNGVKKKIKVTVTK